MAYPMLPAKKLGVFISELKEKYGVVEKELDGIVNGHSMHVRYLFRKVGEQIWDVPIFNLDDEEMLTPFTMMNILRRLDIPPSDFGFILD